MKAGSFQMWRYGAPPANVVGPPMQQQDGCSPSGTARKKFHIKDPGSYGRHGLTLFPCLSGCLGIDDYERHRIRSD